MSAASLTSAMGLLGAAVTALRAASALDEYAERVLGRLGDDEDGRGAKAFGAIATDDRQAAKILLACIEAEALSRTFLERITVERAKSNHLEACADAIATLRKFLDETAAVDPRDRLSANIRISEADRSTAKQGLYVVEQLVNMRKQVAVETPLRIGATRKTAKTATKNPAETAAIGWLAQGVRRICGRAHAQHVAVLAELALGLSDHPSVDRVRLAEKTRIERDWRTD